MSGTIIGVGLFGLPYVASQAGFVPTVLWLLLLGAVSLAACFMYANMVLRTRERHRLPGYVGKYLGQPWRRVALLVHTVGLVGALVAYVLVGGSFLARIVQPIFGGPEVAYLLVYFLVGAFVILCGGKTLVRTELYLLVLFFLALGWLLVAALPNLHWQNLATVRHASLWLPYGVVFFSVWGATIIPEVIDVVRPKHRALLPMVMVVSIVLAIATYVVFTAAITGVTGADTTPEGITGLERLLRPTTLFMLYVFGILTTFTSYITLGQLLVNVFRLDFRLPLYLAFPVALGVPGLLAIYPIVNFITVIGLTGAVAIGIDTLFILTMYYRSKRTRRSELSLHLPVTFRWVLSLALVFGIIAEVWSILAARG